MGKATYPSLVGLEESRKIADDLIAEAKVNPIPYTLHPTLLIMNPTP